MSWLDRQAAAVVKARADAERDLNERLAKQQKQATQAERRAVAHARSTQRRGHRGAN